MGGRPENPTGGMPWYPPGLVNCSPPALFLLLDPCLLPGCSARAGRFGKLITSVVVSTDCTGRCNYHMITTTRIV
jgi:hypothetical protein